MKHFPWNMLRHCAMLSENSIESGSDQRSPFLEEITKRNNINWVIKLCRRVLTTVLSHKNIESFSNAKFESSLLELRWIVLSNQKKIWGTWMDKNWFSYNFLKDNNIDWDRFLKDYWYAIFLYVIWTRLNKQDLKMSCNEKCSWVFSKKRH